MINIWSCPKASLNQERERERMGETGLTLSPFLIGGRGGLHSPVYRWLLPKEHIHYNQVTAKILLKKKKACES